MYHTVTDYDGNLLFVPIEPRNSPPPPRIGGLASRPRPRTRPRRPIVVQQAPAPYPYPPMHAAGYPVPHGPMHMPQAGLDMRTGLKALGAILPGVGQLVSAFRRAPEKPDFSGNAERDLPRLMEYIADRFDHDRSGSQMNGVLATTGAVLQILGDL